MTATLSRLTREVALLRARAAPAPEPMTRLEMANRLGIELDDWQRRALQSDQKQLLLNVSRQGGKSTVAALLGLHEIISTPNALVLAVSPGERQSKLLFRTLLRSWRALGKPVAATTENVLSLELVNGSAGYALPSDGDRIRGFSGVTLLLVDEASRISDPLMAAVRPMLATTDGRLVTMSTPAGPSGWWYQAWAEGGDDWQRFEVPATAIPRISPAFLATERRALPRLVYQAEYECQFTQSADQVFDRTDIAAALVEGLAFVRLFTDEEMEMHDVA
jgi:hypothetical protein